MRKFSDKQIVKAAEWLDGKVHDPNVLIPPLKDTPPGWLGNEDADLLDQLVLMCENCFVWHLTDRVFQQSGELVCEDCYDRELGED